MRLVLDASVAIGWLLPDEPSLALTLDATSALLVPPVFAYEIAYAMQKAERRKRLTPDEVAEAFNLLDGFPIRIETAVALTAREVWNEATSRGANAYDSAYLALALRLDLPLATADRQLAEVARTHGLTVLAPA